MAESLDNKVENTKIKPLIEGDAKKYHGKHVAMISQSKKIIAYGKNLSRVLRKANKSGREYCTFFVPDPNIIYIY